MTTICIYGASSNKVDPIYKDAAYTLGSLIAEAGLKLVCGGGRSGLMAAAIDGALDRGGETIGVLPQFMMDNNWHHLNLTKTVVTSDMHERKATMADISDAVIALPGGCGTLEELLEIITWRQLNLFHGKIVILNIEGYYDPLLEMLQRIMEKGFMSKEYRVIWEVASTPEKALAAALSESPRIEVKKL